MLETEDKLPFTEHLSELRKRLINCTIAVVIGFGISYYFSKDLFDIITLPLREVWQAGDTLIYKTLPEPFFTYIKTALISGIGLAIPYIFYQLWMFVAPGLYDKERRLLFPIIFISTLLFISGVLFAYFVVFPFANKFFLGFRNEHLKPMLTMGDYLSYTSKLLLAFGLVFELPVILTFLSKLGLVTPGFLSKNRKYALILFFACAAILTPPDVVTQIFMALPMILMYELGILGAKMFGRKPLGVDTSDEEPGADSDKKSDEKHSEDEAPAEPSDDR